MRISRSINCILGIIFNTAALLQCVMYFYYERMKSPINPEIIRTFDSLIKVIKVTDYPREFSRAFASKYHSFDLFSLRPYVHTGLLLNLIK